MQCLTLDHNRNFKTNLLPLVPFELSRGHPLRLTTHHNAVKLRWVCLLGVILNIISNRGLSRHVEGAILSRIRAMKLAISIETVEWIVSAGCGGRLRRRFVEKAQLLARFARAVVVLEREGSAPVASGCLCVVTVGLAIAVCDICLVAFSHVVRPLNEVTTAGAVDLGILGRGAGGGSGRGRNSSGRAQATYRQINHLGDDAFEG